MALDPICGMTVDEASALCSKRNGQTFYFYSENCRHKFLSESATAKPETKKQQKAPDKATYTCPMHPEVEQDHPGNCPKCSPCPIGREYPRGGSAVRGVTGLSRLLTNRIWQNSHEGRHDE